jgi:hypothetical protein
MTTRNLSQRLKRLEARIIPASEPPMTMTIQFVGPDREVKSSLVVELGRVRKKHENSNQTN